MYIENRIKLRNNIYYVRVEIEYKKNKNDLTRLCIKNYKDTYFDCGDFSILIEKIERSYTEEKAKKYDQHILLLSDVLYIYDRIPFLTGIGDLFISKGDNLPNSISYISKDDIEKYIKDNNIKMNVNNNFKLYDENTWFI